MIHASRRKLVETIMATTRRGGVRLRARERHVVSMLTIFLGTCGEAIRSGSGFITLRLVDRDPADRHEETRAPHRLVASVLGSDGTKTEYSVEIRVERSLGER